MANVGGPFVIEKSLIVNKKRVCNTRVNKLMLNSINNEVNINLNESPHQSMK